MTNVFDIKREKARITILEGDQKNQYVEAMFNPNEYNVAIAGVFSGENAKDPFFKETKIDDFPVKLIFDTYENHGKNESGTDVRKQTEMFTKLIMPTVEGSENKKPPLCRFSWGNFEYIGVITRIDQKFILFLPNGTPVREELSLTFKAVMAEKEYLKMMGFGACRKTWTVKSGDRLDLIASFELKDASLWRKIAEENNIDNPLLFPEKDDIGKRIIIPDRGNFNGR